MGGKENGVKMGMHLWDLKKISNFEQKLRHSAMHGTAYCEHKPISAIFCITRAGGWCLKFRTYIKEST